MNSQHPASGNSLNQFYDGDRPRGKKTESGVTTYYLRSSVLGGQVVAETNSSGGWLRGYVYLGGQLVAIQSAGAINTVHQDPVTKSQRVTNSAGTVISIVDLDPWGGETGRNNNQAFQPHRFTSYERDANGGDDAMMRRHQSSMSRFSQPDPYDGSCNITDPQSFNRYAYVQNDPVNFVDPSGLLLEGPGQGCGRWMTDPNGNTFWVPCATATVTVTASDPGTSLFGGSIFGRVVEVGVGIDVVAEDDNDLNRGPRGHRGGSLGTQSRTRPKTPYDVAYSTWLMWESCRGEIVRKYIKMREDYLALGGEAFWLEVGAVIAIMTAAFEGEAFAVAGGVLIPIHVHYQQRARLNQINSDYTREVAETCGAEVAKPARP